MSRYLGDGHDGLHTVVLDADAAHDLALHSVCDDVTSAAAVRHDEGEATHFRVSARRDVDLEEPVEDVLNPETATFTFSDGSSCHAHVHVVDETRMLVSVRDHCGSETLKPFARPRNWQSFTSYDQHWQSSARYANI